MPPSVRRSRLVHPGGRQKVLQRFCDLPHKGGAARRVGGEGAGRACQEQGATWGLALEGEQAQAGEVGGEMPARLLHAGLDRVHWAIHDGSNLLIGTVVIVAQLHHRPLFGPESGEGRGDCAGALLAYQALLEGRCHRGVGPRGGPRWILPCGRGAHFERFILGNPKNPGRDASDALVGGGLLPDGQHHVVQHIFDLIGLPE